MESTSSKKIFGHPLGLYILFFTEMWERFSFYGMKAILLFYLTKYHLFTDEESLMIKGSYASLVYAIPLFGGYLADYFLGFRKAVVFGAILLVLGHIGMAFEGFQAIIENGKVIRDEKAIQILFFSLSLIVVGVGFLKSNISSIVGELYDITDGKRDAGFTLFHLGINLGSLLATFSVSYLGEVYGWSYGFGLAGIGMVLGLITFILGKPYLKGKGETLFPERLNKTYLGIKTEYLIYLSGIILTFIIWQIIQNNQIVQNLLIVTGLISVTYIIYYSVTKMQSIERERLYVLLIIMFSGIVFWTLFEQSFTSMNFFAERVVDRQIGSKLLPAGSILSLNSFFILILGMFFASLWTNLEQVGKNPNIIIKTAIGIIFVGIGFYFMVLGGEYAQNGKIALFWMVFTYLFHTIGEICIYPIALSSVTKLAPTKILGFMMGFYFLTISFSEFLATKLATLAKVETVNGVVTNIEQAKETYINFFTQLAGIGILYGLILLLISPFLKKFLH